MSAENKLATAINGMIIEFARFQLEKTLKQGLSLEGQLRLLDAYEAGSDCDFIESKQDDGSILREAEFNSTAHDNISDELSNASMDLKYAVYAASKDFVSALKDEIIAEVRDCLKLELKMEIIAELGKLDMLDNKPNTSARAQSNRPGRSEQSMKQSVTGLEVPSGRLQLQSDDLEIDFNAFNGRRDDADNDLPESLKNNEMFMRLNNAINRSRQTGGSYYSDDDLIAARRGRIDPNDPNHSFDFNKLREINFDDDNNVNPEFDKLFAEKFGTSMRK
jgi:hypothetical protein